MADDRRTRIVFGHNSAADCPFSVKFCVRLFHRIAEMGQYRCSTERIFLFSWCRFGFGERRLTYRLLYTCFIFLNIHAVFWIFMALYFWFNIIRVAQRLSKIVYQCGAGIHAVKRIISKRRICNGNSTSRSYFFSRNGRNFVVQTTAITVK